MSAYKSEDLLARAVGISLVGLCLLCLVLTVVFVSSCASVPQIHTPTVKVLPQTLGNVIRTSAFAKLSSMRVRPTGPYTQAVLEAAGNATDAVVVVDMVTDKPHLHTCREVGFLAGSHQLQAVDGGLAGKIVANNVVERIFVVLNEDGLAMLAMAPSFTAKACDVSVHIEGEQMDSLRSFAITALNGPWGATL